MEKNIRIIIKILIIINILLNTILAVINKNIYLFFVALAFLSNYIFNKAIEVQEERIKIRDEAINVYEKTVNSQKELICCIADEAYKDISELNNQIKKELHKREKDS